MLKEWNEFSENRRKYLISVWALGKLPPTEQTKILQEALKTSQIGNVLAYLFEIENPTQPPGPRPVTESMSRWLMDVATFPGEWSAKARILITALAGDNLVRERLLALMDEKVTACRSNPDDDEIWLYTALMLRELDPARFKPFLSECRTHKSQAIQEVATFFD